ncbi:DeoR/GlpR family DNA-binding transcription regulator [Roseibium sp. SCPC15]|uniref:DeoR/GlpR family DNA-binding transcription regulator n=1 Tax=Roseibium sp. SCP15 TaxID=3141376 RepID=UPI003337E419
MSSVSYLPEQRRSEILAILSRGEPVSAAELAVRFSVSEDAIRRDLRKLAAEGLCEKVYGGALPVSPSAQPYSSRAGEDRSRKEALATVALTLLMPRQCVFLDVGSTNALLAEMLPSNLDLTVVTNSVPVMAALMDRPGISLFALGGSVGGQAGGMTGAQAVSDMERYRFDLAFLGTCSLCPETGVTAFDGDDAEVKRAAARNSEKIAVMVTTDKLGARLPHKVLPMEQIDYLVSEGEAAQQPLHLYQTQNNQILTTANVDTNSVKEK